MVTPGTGEKVLCVHVPNVANVYAVGDAGEQPGNPSLVRVLYMCELALELRVL